MLKLLTPEEVAKILQISTGQLANWRSARKGPPWLKTCDGLRGSVRYEQETLRDWIMSRMINNTPKPDSIEA